MSELDAMFAPWLDPAWLIAVLGSATLIGDVIGAVAIAWGGATKGKA